jgi:iron complex transport system ATP-binding protein
MRAILEVSGLRVTRGSTEILRGVDWRVAAGEHWAILGPNGCGKTSLLKALVGYLAPTRGSIALLGRRYGHADWRELRLRIGIVSSALQAAVPPAESAIETVVSGRYAQLDLWARPTSADRAAARSLLRVAGIAALAGREWAYLSQGERQRVLIARALMARPRLLILDEPCAGLDPVAREEFLRLVEGLARRRRGPALVLVTHHVEEITPGFSHLLLLRAGRAVASGPRRRILTSANLSAAFGAPVRLVRQRKSLRLEIK